jgi:chemotaxis protein MotB
VLLRSPREYVFDTGIEVPPGPRIMRFDSSVVDFEELSIQEKYEEEVEQIREQFDLFKGFIKKRRLDKAIEIMETEEGMLIRMANPILFESGKADLRPEAYEVLERLFGILSTFDAKIRVEGHTDNVPINNERYPSNWELSAARAINVLKFFNRLGIEGERLTAVGHGKFHPLVDNDTPENRSQNRRVEIRVDYKEDLERTTIRRLLKENENEEDSDG